MPFGSKAGVTLPDWLKNHILWEASEPYLHLRTDNQGRRRGIHPITTLLLKAKKLSRSSSVRKLSKQPWYPPLRLPNITRLHDMERLSAGPLNFDTRMLRRLLTQRCRKRVNGSRSDKLAETKINLKAAQFLSLASTRLYHFRHA